MTARTDCRRCGEPLVVSLVGVPHCPACHRRDHPEILALVAGLRAETDRLHQRLTVIAAAQEQPGVAA